MALGSGKGYIKKVGTSIETRTRFIKAPPEIISTFSGGVFLFAFIRSKNVSRWRSQLNDYLDFGVIERVWETSHQAFMQITRERDLHK